MPQRWLAALMRLLLEPASCVMQRRMLLGIKQRAERTRHGDGRLSALCGIGAHRRPIAANSCRN
ncbi:MAG TPA: hypothetical protein PLJ35_14675 [Anaerolineae bacterium]|nr:hypothetical protein [Anaerolineae bacterium]HOR00058.1 hypothetical protein [Anaerolineae bacterium]HPL30953.1 hypothetical protein [Anaerolineae bacterium]